MTSFLSVEPHLIGSAATHTEFLCSTIGSAANAVNPATTALMAAGGDEISRAAAATFSDFGV